MQAETDGGRVLVVASDTAFAAELHRLLERHRFETRVRPSADQALEALQSSAERFDLAVLDSSVPYADLLRVYAHLRGGDQPRQVPIIFTRSPFAQPGPQRGPDAYLPADAPPHEVARRVAEQLAPRVEPGPPTTALSIPSPEPVSVEPPAGGGARTALLGVLLGIAVGIAILVAIWLGGVPVTLPLLSRLDFGWIAASSPVPLAEAARALQEASARAAR